MTIHGNCHCGKVAFEISGEIPATLTRCTDAAAAPVQVIDGKNLW